MKFICSERIWQTEPRSTLSHSPALSVFGIHAVRIDSSKAHAADSFAFDEAVAALPYERSSQAGPGSSKGRLLCSGTKNG